MSYIEHQKQIFVSQLLADLRRKLKYILRIIPVLGIILRESEVNSIKTTYAKLSKRRIK